jgi:hypothetical protein
MPAVAGDAQPAPPVTAPAEITQFYHDVNFAACFSNQEERKLVKHMINAHAASKLPKRLQRVAQAVQRVHDASRSIDPHIVHDPGSWAGATEELTEVFSITKDGDQIRVEVRLRSLSPQAKSWLVSQYEKPAQQAAPADMPLVLAETMKQSAREEVHVWVQEKGRWLRQEAAIVLLRYGR